MAWTTPTAKSPGATISSSEYNAEVKDNLIYLLGGRVNSILKRDNNAAYTTTSTTFVAVDSTNLSITMTTSGPRVIVGFTGMCTFATAGAALPMFDITVDGTRIGSAGASGLLTQSGQTGLTPICIVQYVSGLSAASHTFQVVWRVASGASGNAVLYSGDGTAPSTNTNAANDSIPTFWAVEIG